MNLSIERPQERRIVLISAAVEPVVDRLQKKYKAAQEALKFATESKDKAAAEIAQNALNALLLFQSDTGASQRLHTDLSQIFDYGNTAIEKHSNIYKQVLRLLEFGREREGIDLSKVVLTHHTPEAPGQAPDAARRGRQSQAGTDHRSRRRQRSREAEGVAERAHRTLLLSPDGKPTATQSSHPHKQKTPVTTGLFVTGTAGTRTPNQRIMSQRKSADSVDEKRDFDATGPTTGPSFLTGPMTDPVDVAPVDPELAKILAAWSDVPEHLKAVAVANVLALVATARNTSQ